MYFDKYEQIPIEVIAKFNERGEIRPVKFMYADEVYIVDKIFSQKIAAPPGLTYAMQVFVCLVKGHKRNLYYDKYKNTWYIVKQIKVTSLFNPIEYEGC